MKKYITKQSNIKGAGKGLFTKDFFKKGEVIGLAHVDDQPASEIGRNHNHNEKNPTAYSKKINNKRFIYASKNLKPGEEITTNYRLQPELEQPEDFKKKKGGSMTPQKDGYRTYSPFKNLPYIDVKSDTIDSDDIVYDLKLKANNGLTKFIKKNTGLHTLPGAKVIREIPVKRKGGSVLRLPNKKNSKGYSRSLSATNKLFTQNFLFAKPKSRKNKVFDPNSKYYAEGGEPCPYGQVWSKKDKKCIDLPVFGNSLNSKTFTKLTNLSDGFKIKPLNSFSDFGKIKPKKIPVVKDSFLETLEKDINDFLDNPLKKAAQVSESLKEKGEDPSDALRHSTAGALAAQTIANKTGNIPFISNPLGYLGANIAGIGHELSTLSQAYLDDRPWSVKLQESLEDIYNNSVGTNTIFNNNSEKDKINYLLKLTRTNQLPDGYGEERPFRDNPKWTDPYNQKQDGGITKLTPKEEKQFQNFYKTLPNNLQSDDDTYDIRGYWDSEQRPTEFDYTQPKDKDGFYHAYSINSNTGEYLKSPAHPTFQHAVDEDRKIGYRPITNVQGRNIAIENKSIADPEEQSFLRNTEGPINYIEADLDEDEIQAYKDGGYVVEDISIPSLNQMQNGGENENLPNKVQDLNEVTIYGNQEKIKLQGSLMDRLKQVKKAYNDHRVNLGLEKQKQSAEGTSSIISLKDQIQSYKKELNEEKKSYAKASKALNVLKKYNPESYKKAKVSDVLNATGVDDLRNLYKEGKISDATFMDFYDNFGKLYDREATRTTEEDQLKLEDSWYGQPDEEGRTRWMGNPNNVAKVAQTVAIGAPLAATAPMMAPAVVSTLANPYVAGGLNAYFAGHGINEFSDPNSLTRKSMSRAYNNPTGSNIGDAAFDVGMNSLNFVGLPFGKAIKGANPKNIAKRILEIPSENMTARLSPEDLKIYRQVQDIARLRAKNVPYSKQLITAMEYNIPEEHLLNIFGKSKSEIEELIPFMKEQEAFRLANPASERINLVRPARSATSRGAYGEYTLGERVAPMSNDFTEELIAMANSSGMSVDELARFRDPLQYSRDNIIADRLMSRVDRDDIIRDALSQPNITNIAGVEEYVSNYIINNPIRRGRILIGQETPRQSLYDAFKEDVSDAANFFNSKGNALNKKVKKNLEKFISDYPVHEGVVLQNLPTLNLRSSGSLKKVSDKVANNSTANISSGDVFTGSLNTSHSSYLPQLKQVFKYKDGAPQFLGYKPMNNAGFLSEFHYSPEQINKYLNTEIDDLIKKGIVPNNIERPFLKNESIMLPHYGIKQYQDGGTYTVKGSKGVYKKVNGKWQVDWNRSGKYQPLSKGDVKARTAVLDKMAKPVNDGMSKVSSNSSDNTRVNNIYQKPLSTKNFNLNVNALTGQTIPLSNTKPQVVKPKSVITTNFNINTTDQVKKANAITKEKEIQETILANERLSKNALPKREKTQTEFEADQWKKYNKLDWASKLVDRGKAFGVDPIGMTSRVLTGDQGYIPGMGKGIFSEDENKRSKFLKSINYTPGKFEVSDVQNLLNPFYWGASAGSTIGDGLFNSKDKYGNHKVDLTKIATGTLDAAFGRFAAKNYGKSIKNTLQGINYIKNSTQPFRKATVSSFKTPLPLGKKITDATGGKLNLGNSVAAYFGADALYNQGDSKSDVVKSQSNFINNPSWYTLGDAAYETSLNNLGFLGLGLGKQVFKPAYNASKNLIKGFKGVPKQLPGSSNVNFLKNIKTNYDFSPENLKEAFGFLPRRQFIKNLQKEKLVGKNFQDLNYAARSTDKTNKLTQLALNREATKFRGVQGTVPKDGIGTQEYTGRNFNMSKPSWSNEISEFENMKNAGVNFNDPVSIAKYQATHIPMEKYGYTAGMGDFSHAAALYTSNRPSDYGKYMFKMHSPRDYSIGNYQDWFNKYHNLESRKWDKLAVKDGYWDSQFMPNNPYDLPILLNRNTVVGKKGQKMFDIDETYPFMDYKNLGNKQIEYEEFLKKLDKDFDTGFRGQYKQGGATNDYVDVDLTPEEIKDLIAQGYVIEELN